MGVYDIFKDAISMAQKADNLPLVRDLIDGQKQILDLMAENAELKKKIEDLIKKQDISANIVRHKEAIITLKNDDLPIIYCSRCWDSEQKLIQTETLDNGHCSCPECKTTACYNGDLSRRTREEISERWERQIF